MGVSYKNIEGYSDPVPYEALKYTGEHKHKYRPLVYICSPFSGDVEKNINKARGYSRFAVDKGVIPIAPHLLLPQYLDEATERDLAIFMDIVLLTKCKELWVFGEEVSAGMRIEIDQAKKRNLKIKYFTEDLMEVKNETNII